ncbi:MAG: hypothetical protein ISS87_00175 [Candidatus Pacebacteria bacterium]|nr:hypothetical protein [Candidatus Paceibacterota bacterium]
MNVDLTERQKRIIIGTLLGDGFLIRRNKKVIFGFKQREKHKEYVEWIFNELQNICTDAGIMHRTDYDQYYFRTSLKKHDFIDLHQKFYRFSPGMEKAIKIVPKDINKLLKDPISIAVWYMDDGSLDFRPKYHYSYSLATHNFLLEEVEKLRDVLKENFGVKVNVYNNLIRGKRYPRIYIGVAGRERFKEIVENYVSRFNCFSHKLPPK